MGNSAQTAIEPPFSAFRTQKLPRLGAGERKGHTSWMMAISAASPRRGPIFSTRV